MMGRAARRKMTDEERRFFSIKHAVGYDFERFPLDPLVILRELLARCSEDAFSAAMRAVKALNDRLTTDPQKRTLCLTCDHVFDFKERPGEVALALPWDSDHPVIVSPVCAACAAEDYETKLAKTKSAWGRLSDPATTHFTVNAGRG